MPANKNQTLSKNHSDRIAVVDDESMMRKSLSFMLSRVGFQVETFPSIKQFLDHWNESAKFDCLILDYFLQNSIGLELVDRLHDSDVPLPVIMFSGKAGIDEAVNSMHRGVFTFLEKPVNDRRLIQNIRNAINQSRDHEKFAKKSRSIQKSYQKLTIREKEVLHAAIDGEIHRETASRLDLSIKSIEHYRKSMKAKLGIKRMSELLQFVDLFQKERITERAS